MGDTVWGSLLATMDLTITLHARWQCAGRFSFKIAKGMEDEIRRNLVAGKWQEDRPEFFAPPSEDLRTGIIYVFGDDPDRVYALRPGTECIGVMTVMKKGVRSR
jgi:hypothetical protein